MVSSETDVLLKYLPPLRKGQTTAPEPKPRHLIPDANFNAVCAFLPSYFRDVVEVLHLTGMRPSELTNMRVCDIDRSGKIELYCPEHHKTEHSGGRRCSYRSNNPEDTYRSPGRQSNRRVCFHTGKGDEFARADQRAKRKSPLQPSQVKRERKRKEHKLDRFNAQLTPSTIGRNVARACQKATKAKKLSQPWTPYELRHTAITEVRKKFGADAAPHFAGHSNVGTQKFYDHSALITAQAVAWKIG